ncbi:M48 family metallopeptidase [Paracoccus alcaliphilus]|nr:M48 family metallopeptidase [Paracoccus alcaliphilus]
MTRQPVTRHKGGRLAPLPAKGWNPICAGTLSTTRLRWRQDRTSDPAIGFSARFLSSEPSQDNLSHIRTARTITRHVVIHEPAHGHHPDHSAKFRITVEQHPPDWKQRDDQAGRQQDSG